MHYGNIGNTWAFGKRRIDIFLLQQVLARKRSIVSQHLRQASALHIMSTEARRSGIVVQLWPKLSALSLMPETPSIVKAPQTTRNDKAAEAFAGCRSLAASSAEVLLQAPAALFGFYSLMESAKESSHRFLKERGQDLQSPNSKNWCPQTSWYQNLSLLLI